MGNDINVEDDMLFLKVFRIDTFNYKSWIVQNSDKKKIDNVRG